MRNYIYLPYFKGEGGGFRFEILKTGFGDNGWPFGATVAATPISTPQIDFFQ